MVRLPDDRDDPIGFLVRRKFPAIKAYQHPMPLTGNSGAPPYEERRAYLDEAEAYATELANLPTAELEALFESERQKEWQQSVARREAEEQGRFFNAPSSRADFAHWAKATYWTLEEAIALSFGKSPDAVSWKRLERYQHVSPFVAEYAKVRDLATRAKNWKQLYDPVMPGIFLAWAQRNDITYPEELATLVEQYGHNIRDWQTAYGELQAAFERQKAEYEEEAAKAMRGAAEVLTTIESLRDEVTELAGERKALLARLKAVESAGKPLNPKERDSVLKLIIGMAVAGYSYDPKAQRSPITKEITDDIASIGLTIDQDTVRRWLQEAAGLLPREPE